MHAGEEVSQFGGVEESQGAVVGQVDIGEIDPQADPRVVEERHHRLGSDHVDVDDVAGGRGKEGGEEGPPVDVVSVGGFEGEEDPGGRSFENRGHPGRRSCGEEDLYVLAPQPLAEALGDGEAGSRTGVD